MQSFCAGTAASKRQTSCAFILNNNFLYILSLSGLFYPDSNTNLSFVPYNNAMSLDINWGQSHKETYPGTAIDSNN